MTIVPETIPESEGELEQLLAAPVTTDEKVAETAALIASLRNTPPRRTRRIHRRYLPGSDEKSVGERVMPCTLRMMPSL